jgi:hypothetical protein
MGEHAALLSKIREHMSDVFKVVGVPEFEERLDKLESDPSSRKLSTLVGDAKST